MNKILKNTIILTLITLVAGLGLGFVYEITKEPIAQAQDSAFLIYSIFSKLAQKQTSMILKLSMWMKKQQRQRLKL